MGDLERDINHLKHMGFEEEESLAALLRFPDTASQPRLELALNYLLQKENATSETPRGIKSMLTN